MQLPSLEAEAAIKAERAIRCSAANGEQTSSKKTAFCVQLPSRGDHSEHVAEGNEVSCFPHCFLLFVDIQCIVDCFKSRGNKVTYSLR